MRDSSLSPLVLGLCLAVLFTPLALVGLLWLKGLNDVVEQVLEPVPMNIVWRTCLGALIPALLGSFTVTALLGVSRIVAPRVLLHLLVIILVVPSFTHPSVVMAGWTAILGHQGYISALSMGYAPALNRSVIGFWIVVAYLSVTIPALLLFAHTGRRLEEEVTVLYLHSSSLKKVVRLCISWLWRLRRDVILVTFLILSTFYFTPIYFGNKSQLFLLNQIREYLEFDTARALLLCTVGITIVLSTAVITYILPGRRVGGPRS